MKKLFYKKITPIILGSFLFLLGSIGVASAQLPLGTGVTVSTVPTIPQPGEIVTIQVESFSTDLNQADISWYVNGSLQASGKAKKSFDIKAGSVGSVQTVTISIDTKNFGVVERRVVIAPAGIDIVEQSDSFTPPFYRGKALTPTESSVTLVAIPSFILRGARVPTSSIVFTWKQRGRVLGSSSGLGKNTLTVKGPRISAESMAIEAEGRVPGEVVSAYARYILSPSDPEIILYEDNPLTGASLNKALGANYSLTKDEISLVAYPYFFSSDSVDDSNFSYSWNQNSKPISPTGETRNLLTLRKPEGSGISDISITITNTKKLFESARSALRIEFGGGEEGNFFGS